MQLLNGILVRLPQSLSQRLPLLVLASFMTGAVVATWTTYNLQERRSALLRAETSGAILWQILQAAHTGGTAPEQDIYTWQKQNSFTAHASDHTVPIILTLGAERFRAAVVFNRDPRLRDLLRAAPSRQSPDRRLADLSKAIARQDLQAKLAVFLADGDTLILQAPGMWRNRPSETAVALIGLATFIAVIATIMPLAMNLAAPFQNLTAPRRKPLPRLASTEAIEAKDYIDQLKENFDDQQEKRVRGLAAISHDLRTPVTRLRLRTELLTDPQTRDKFTSDLDEISGIVDGALDLLSIRHQPETSYRFSLASLLESLVDDYQDMGQGVTFQRADQMNIPGVTSVFGQTSLITVQATGESMMRGQPDKLRRAVTNLIDNGLKYGEEVTVSVVPAKDDMLDIRVRDYGPGIPPENLESMMMPFVRGHGHQASQGVGLGLSIANEIVELHGGSLTLENASPGLRAVMRIRRNLD